MEATLERGGHRVQDQHTPMMRVVTVTAVTRAAMAVTRAVTAVTRDAFVRSQPLYPCFTPDFP